MASPIIGPRARHCPFLNRGDARCAPQFSIGHLEFAMDHCCGNYATCAAYRDLLAERLAARAAAVQEQETPYADLPTIPLTVHGRPA